MGGYNTTSTYCDFGTKSYPVAQHSGFIAQFDSAGNANWARFMQSNCAVYSIATDACNNIWATGSMGYHCGVLANHTPTIMVDSITVLDTPAGTWDAMFLIEYDHNGILLDHKVLQSGGDDIAPITGDNFGNIYLSGDYENTDPFVIGHDTMHLYYPSEGENIFVAKYTPHITCPLGVDQIQTSQNNIAIYPNPATTELTITSPNKITQLTITNLIGQQVYSHEYNTETVLVNVAGLPNGIYFIKINGSEVGRFVKE